MNAEDWGSGEFWGGAEGTTLLDSKLILLWGVDVLLNYPENSYYLLLAKDKGIPIIYIDPRMCWTANFADQWIPNRQVQDAAV